MNKIFLLSLLLSFQIPMATANDFTGTWKLGSRACSTDAPYEDPFFASFMKSFSWEFLANGSLVERMSMFDPEKNFTCEATLEYSVELLPPAPGRLGFMKRMNLTRSGFHSNCLRQNARPLSIQIHYLDYPSFLETYEESNQNNGAPCPSNDFVITQFRKQ